MRQWLATVACLATVMLYGCAGVMDAVPDFLRVGPWWKAAQTDDISSRAGELEAHGELTMALDHWRLAHRIGMNQATTRSEIIRLENKIAAAVQDHYEKGLAELGKKNPGAARNHFLAALRLNPAFQPALKQIKARFSPFPLAVYLSVPGDRPATVAEKIFGDGKKAFLVAWFNDLSEDATVPPGTILILPKLKRTPSENNGIKPKPDPLAEARERLAHNDLDGALMLARQADTADPGVQTLIHTIHLYKATEQIESGLPELARPFLASVPDGFTGKETIVKKLGTALKKRQLVLDLANAREQFEQGEYQHSLDLAESLLRNTPDNADASDLVSEARYRLAMDHVDHKRFIEARETLEKADQGHEPSAALKETLRVRLVQLGQVHYRKGVKHYINEDLQAAIGEWEKALACNPDHAKARENIENARRLLDKIERMP